MRKIIVNIAILVVTLLACYLYSSSFLYDEMDDRISTSSLFWLRDTVGKTVQLSDKLTILAWDDATYSELGDPSSLDGEKFDFLMKVICHNKPRRIIIDKKYAVAFKDAAKNEIYKTALSRCKVSTIADFVDLNQRDFDKVEGQAESVREDLLDEFKLKELHPLSNTAPETDERLYAANPLFLEAVDKIGFANYLDPGFVFPARRIQGRVIPHIGLTSALNVEVIGERINIDSQQTPLLVGVQTFVNWVQPEKLYRRSVSAGEFYKVHRQRDSLDSKAINEDDTVLLLPLMFTGSVDFHLSPYGEVPGGHSLASVVNSVMLGSWLRVVGGTKTVAYILLVLASLLMMIPKSMKINLGIILVANLTLLAAASILFVYYSTMFRWVNAALFLNLGFIPQFILEFYSREMKLKSYQQALSGVVSPEVLQYINRNPGKIDLTPCESEITIVFIDFISFSTLAEQSDPKEIFTNLRSSLNLLTKIVHQYGGIVDKSLGDGLLCYFGYDPIKRTKTDNHADQALNASIQMQEIIAGLWLNTPADTPECLPIRIGMNTGKAMIGNVCDDEKIDLSVIGHTVNLAQRYEGNCEPFKIMLGPSTRMKLKSTKFLQSIRKRKIKIKHYLGQYNAYEFDPFEYNPFYKKEQNLLKAIQNFRDFIKLERKDERYLVEEEWQASLINPEGEVIGRLLNYSSTGICVEIDTYVAYSAEVLFKLRVTKEDEVQIESNYLTGRVMWGKPFREGYLHGIEFVFKTPDERIQYLELLKIKPE